MGKVLKEVDYLQLVVTIYQISGLNKDKLITLYKYIVNYMNDNKFSNEYSLKLQVDLMIDDPPNIQFRSLEKELENNFKPEEITLFKVFLFDVTQRGYYS